MTQVGGMVLDLSYTRDEVTKAGYPDDEVMWYIDGYLPISECM